MELGDILYLSRHDVEQLGLSHAEILETVHKVFAEKGRGETESPPKRGIVPRPGCSMRAMNAFIPSLGAAGVKWISGFPSNVGRGLPTITGLMILNDLETGMPKAVMDCTWTTAVRTAASTVVAARYLARPDSSTVGLIACGVQGRSNLEALCAAFEVTAVRAYDLDPGRAEAFAAEMSTKLMVDIEPVGTPAEAVAGLDIVVTSMPAVKRPRPPIGPGTLSPGSFACLLDFDAAFSGDAVRESNLFVTDDAPQLAFFKRIGYFRDTPEPDVDLGKLVSGRLRGRQSEGDRTIAMNLGIGLLDVAMASLVYDRACREKVGTRLPL